MVPLGRSSTAVRRASDSMRADEQATHRVLEPPLETRFPWFEYVVRAGWLPSGDGYVGAASARDDPRSTWLRSARLAIDVCRTASVWAELLDRAQQHLAIVLFDMSDFQAVSAPDGATEPARSAPVQADEPACRAVVLLEERSSLWINVRTVAVPPPQVSCARR